MKVIAGDMNILSVNKEVLCFSIGSLRNDDGDTEDNAW